MSLLFIDMKYACAGIIVEQGIVTDAAPIFRWMIGKRSQEVREWVKAKHGRIEVVTNAVLAQCKERTGPNGEDLG